VKVGVLGLAFSGLLTSAAANASLIGTTVVYTNPNPGISGTFTIADGPEEHVCTPVGADPCALIFELDYGADYALLRLINNTNFDFPTATVTTTSSVFDPSVNIVAIDIDSNFPGAFSTSFTSHSFSSVVQPWVWAAHSDYLTTVHITTVPEPDTISLMAAGLLLLAYVQRRRFVAGRASS
jgi:hypothetical protein